MEAYKKIIFAFLNFSGILSFSYNCKKKLYQTCVLSNFVATCVNCLQLYSLISYFSYHFTGTDHNKRFVLAVEVVYCLFWTFLTFFNFCEKLFFRQKYVEILNFLLAIENSVAFYSLDKIKSKSNKFWCCGAGIIIGSYLFMFFNSRSYTTFLSFVHILSFYLVITCLVFVPIFEAAVLYRLQLHLEELQLAPFFDLNSFIDHFERVNKCLRAFSQIFQFSRVLEYFYVVILSTVNIFFIYFWLMYFDPSRKTGYMVSFTCFWQLLIVISILPSYLWGRSYKEVSSLTSQFYI